MYGTPYPQLGVERLYLERAKSGSCSIGAEYCMKIGADSFDKYLRSYSDYLVKAASGSNL